MPQKRQKNRQSSSLKTFLVYSYIVAFLILTSVAIKSFFIFKENKLHDGNIVIAVSTEDHMKAVIGIDKERGEAAVLRIDTDNFTADAAWYDLGILTDAEIVINDDVSRYSPGEIVKEVLLNLRNVDTDLTFFDAFKLFTSKKIKNYNSESDFILSNAESTSNVENVIQEFFSDSSIVDEGATIQVINSTAVSGLGQRLEKALVNKGATIVSVTNQEKLQERSEIKSALDNSYTVKKLERLLDLKTADLTENSIADIIIIIGEDMQNSLLL